MGLVFAGSKKQKVLDKSKWLFAVPLLVIGVGLIAMQMGYLESSIGFAPLSVGTFSTGSGGEISTGTGDIVTFQPSATYSTMDKFSTTAVSVGTSYYKEGNNPATTTAISNVVQGKSYTYWLSNASYWITPFTFTATGTNNIINKNALANGSATITVLDGINGNVVSTSGTGGNVTLGADGVANVQIKYQGTAKKSGGAFGGMMVIESNASISSITCTSPDGAILEGNPSNFHVTYTPSLTSHVGRLFEYAPLLDDGTGSVRTINCQFQNGGTAVSGVNDVWYVKFIPADYYASQSGAIVLDTEKFADNSNTRTGSAKYLPSQTMYWS